MTTYVLLAATSPSSTLHARARVWCETFADDWRVLTADGLEDPGTDPTPPTEADRDELARTVDVDRRDLEWTGDVWILADPSLLDEETGDLFRRKLRVVTDRVTDAEARYPYDHLEDAGQRGEWIERCLEFGEIVEPTSVRGGSVKGVTDRQRDLGSF